MMREQTIAPSVGRQFAGAPYPPRALRLIKLLGPTAIWAAYLLLLLPYAALRGLGAHTFQPHDLGKLDQHIFSVEPTLFLQQHIYTHDLVWFDYSGFVLHMTWFFLPLVLGLAVMLLERRKVMEFFAWGLAAYYLSDIAFIAFPVKPPWMEPGITRILLERSFVHYTGLDNNPFAAFPSMHACLPMLLTLFFFLRCDRARFLGWFTGVYALLIGFAVVYLGEHWVVDVLGGYALAGLVAVLFMNGGLRQLYARIPGDPVAQLIRLNDAMWWKPPVEAGEEPAPVAVPEQEAA